MLAGLCTPMSTTLVATMYLSSIHRSYRILDLSIRCWTSSQHQLYIVALGLPLLVVRTLVRVDGQHWHVVACHNPLRHSLFVQVYVMGIPGVMFYLLSNKAALLQVHQIIDYFDDELVDENVRPMTEQKEFAPPRGQGESSIPGLERDSDHRARSEQRAALPDVKKPELPVETRKFMQDYGQPVLDATVLCVACALCVCVYVGMWCR